MPGLSLIVAEGKIALVLASVRGFEANGTR